MKAGSVAGQVAGWLCLGLTLTTGDILLGQTPRDAVEVLRSDLKADRKAFIAENLALTPEESEKFWPIYRDYRTEVDRIADGIVKLVLEYADLYPNLPEEKASELLKSYTTAETKLVAVRTKYLKKLKAALPAAKVFRFAQLDNRLDLGVRVGLAAAIPVLPNNQTTSNP